MKSRVFNITQYEKNPTTGEDLHFCEDNIKQCIGHKTIKQYAYIRHDKDVFTDDDEKNGYTAGKPKPSHWHIVLRTDAALEIEVIAKWLGIPPQYIDVPKGKGAFLDCVRYLTHESSKERQKGKHVYEDTEVIANFDFRGELTKREENKLKYGRDLDREQQILHDVMYSGMTIKQVIKEDRILYMNSYKKVDAARLKYIQQCNPPTTRINFYVTGKGGSGKGLLSRALARSLYPQYDNDDDIFFTVGDGKATFEGYDGQPVIIWNDCRSIELFTILGSRGNIFRVLDTHPTKERQNIKYGSINLINAVNIINSVQPYLDFLNGLAGEYTSNGIAHESEDKGQSYRRIPFIIQIHEEDITMLLNKGFAENTRDYMEYIEYINLVGNFEKIARVCGDNFPLKKQIESQTLKPVTDKYREILTTTQMQKSESEILEIFKDYGKDTGLETPFL